MPAPTTIQRRERRAHVRRKARQPVAAGDGFCYDDIPPLIPTGSQRPVSETLPPAMRRIVQTLDSEKIVLFGSYAYGAPTPDNDPDSWVALVEEDYQMARSARRFARTYWELREEQDCSNQIAQIYQPARRDEI